MIRLILGLVVFAAAVTAAVFFANHPGQVEIEVKGRTIPVTAEQLHGAERAKAWQEITAAAPRFADYQRKTDRELPVIRLAPRPA